MPEKPTGNLPTWATDGGTRVEPSAGQKAAGAVVDQRFPARWFNYISGKWGDWLQFLDSPVGTGAAAPIDASGGTGTAPGLIGRGGDTNGDGVQGVGTAAGVGVKGTGGATNDGVVGVGGSAGATGVLGVGTVGSDGLVGLGGPAAGRGVRGVGGVGGDGVSGVGGAGGGAGVVGSGTLGNDGVVGFGGPAARGMRGVGGVGGVGVDGIGGAGGYGVQAFADVASPDRAALRVVPQDADPSVPAQGDFSVHDITGKISGHDGDNWNRYVPTVLVFGDTDDTDKIIDGVNGDFVTQFSIPANKLRPGSLIRVSAVMGRVGFTSATSVNMQILLDGKVLAQAINSDPSEGGAHMHASAKVSVENIGAAGTAFGSGSAVVQTNTFDEFSRLNIFSFSGGNAIDTTSPLIVKVFVGFGGAGAGDDWALRQLIVEVT